VLVGYIIVCRTSTHHLTLNTGLLIMSDNTPQLQFSPDDIQIKSRHTITPSRPIALGPIFRLSPLDQLVLTFIPVAVIYIYSSHIDIDKLRKSTSILLNTYPHLSGRLGVDPIHGGAHIRNLGTGCEILEATSPHTLEVYRKEGRINLLDLPGKGEDLLAPYEFRNTKIENQVLFTIQHTRFACGGVSLGIRVLHCLNDGVGFFQLVKDLSDIYRNLDDREWEGVKGIAMPYLANWEVEEAIEEEKEEARSYKSVLYHLEPEPQPVKEELGAPDIPILAEAQTEAQAQPTITGRVLHFTTSDLALLKERATNTDSDSKSEKGTYVTTFDALTAHLHQRIHQARSRIYSLNPSLGPIGPPDLLCPIDLRQHLSLDRYPYNAVLTTTTQFSPSLLAHHSTLPQVASMIHTQVRPLKQGDAEKTIKWIASVDRSKIRNDFRGGNGSVMISQWNKMDMYNQAVFQEGVKPELVAPPFTPISLHDGLGYILPTPSGDEGGVNVYLALREGVWEQLDVGVDTK
jgi:hypothetical protein